MRLPPFSPPTQGLPRTPRPASETPAGGLSAAAGVSPRTPGSNSPGLESVAAPPEAVRPSDSQPAPDRDGARRRPGKSGPRTAAGVVKP